MEPETKARADQSPKAAMDQQARDTVGVLKVKEVVGGGSEEASAPPLLAHPCFLLQLLLSACAGCLGLCGYCSDDDAKPAADDDDDLKPAADDDDAAEPAVAETPQEGEGGGGDEEASVSVRDRSHHSIFF